MKKLITALALTAAIATPALAAGYRQEGMVSPNPGYAYNETANGQAYRSYASERMMPMTSTVWHNGMYVGADPDPSVQTQLGIDADTMNNR